MRWINPELNIERRTDDDGAMRLIVVGELDLASAPALSDALTDLPQDRRVRLDLSVVQFIDLAGLRAVLTAVRYAHSRGWPLTVDPDLSAPVRRLLELSHSTGEINGSNP